LHFAGEEVGGGREDFAFAAAFVMGAVDVDSAGGADAVAYECGPLYCC